MAKEESTRNETPMWIKVFIGMALFGLTIYGISQSNGKEAGAHTAQVESHEKRINENCANIKDNTDLIRDEKEQRLIIQGTINNTADDVSEIKEDFKGIQRYLMQYDFEKKGD